MFAASSSVPLPSSFKLCLGAQGGGGGGGVGKKVVPRKVEVLHPVNFVNIAHVRSCKVLMKLLIYQNS